MVHTFHVATQFCRVLIALSTSLFIAAKFQLTPLSYSNPSVILIVSMYESAIIFERFAVSEFRCSTKGSSNSRPSDNCCSIFIIVGSGRLDLFTIAMFCHFHYLQSAVCTKFSVCCIALNVVSIWFSGGINSSTSNFMMGHKISFQ